MTEYLPIPGVLWAENDFSTCQYLEYLKLKITEYLPVTGVLRAANDLSTCQYLEYLNLLAST